MFKKFRYYTKKKYWDLLENKQRKNNKNYIVKNEIYILDKLNESIMYEPTYHNDLYKSIERKIKESSNEHLIELCCIYADIKNILNNLNILDVKLLYLYLENIDYIADKEYNIQNIFSIVDEDDNEVIIKDVSINGNMNRYKVKVNIVKFNLLYNKMKTNWWDSLMKYPGRLVVICIFIPLIIDKMCDLFIGWKFGV